MTWMNLDKPSRVQQEERDVFKGLIAQRLVALFVCAWLVFNFPLLSLWDRDVTVLGIPLLPLAMFVLWGGLIAVLAWWMERPGPALQDD